MKRLKYLLLMIFVFSIIGCEDENNQTYTIDRETEFEHDMSGFARGADVSWLTEMESQGLLFYDTAGVETECMTLLRDMGMNSIRLRVWVNPLDGWCNKSDLLVKAKRANDLGMRIMVDFHYSDEWADPDDQHKPIGWEALTLSELCIAVAEHTTDVLSSLNEWGITPEWIQIGNETTYGMLWNDDDLNADNSGYLFANDGANYSKLHNAGYDAAKAIFPEAKVVIQIDRGYNNDLTNNLLSYIVGKDNGSEDAKFDVIGLSLYPSSANYETLVTSCIDNMKWIVANYGVDVMVCEVGMDWTEEDAGYSFLNSLITGCQDVENCLGVLYWEPQAYNGWKSYSLGAFDNDGIPTKAMQAFKRPD